MQDSYADFLASKQFTVSAVGVAVDSSELSPVLYDFQKAITQWALKRGRAAVWADCGLGKTLIQLEWAYRIGGRVLIVAPLSVAEQTINEGKTKLDLEIKFARHQEDLQDGINITNYEMLRSFIDADLNGIVLDESSILKSIDGKTRNLLLESFTNIPWRLCCTATPCPNDIAELANHAEFLGVMRRVEMLAAFFVHDDRGWRLRGHAREPFFKWLASWAMSLKSPADLGFDASRFILPELNILDATVKAQPISLNGNGMLHGIGDRARVRKHTIDDRIAKALELINASPANQQWVVWCGLNPEQDQLAKALGQHCVSIDGRTPREEKIRLEKHWRCGNVQTLITKLRVFGYGMNWQHCANVIFLGLGDSYEQYYQAIRRSWRYGQTKPVNCHIIVSTLEQQIVANVRRKERESDALSSEIVAAAKRYEIEELEQAGSQRLIEVMERAVFNGPNWRLEQGDCVETLRQEPESSIDLSVYSPPFASLYTYTRFVNDLGNSKNQDEFFEHYGFVIKELLRVTKEGRHTCVHIAQTSTTLVSDGVIGMRDLRGRAVEEYIKRGWIYHGEVVIDKDPQAQAIRTHAKGLLFVQLQKDASWLRPAMADYILVFRKPGENATPVQPQITNEEWIEWARPIWYGIVESDTLNAVEARDSDDDRHICPLQLGVIERCIKLWSNPGELILSPFAGIGSEGYVALQLKRRFLGCELKPRYCEVATRNLKLAEFNSAPLANGLHAIESKLLSSRANRNKAFIQRAEELLAGLNPHSSVAEDLRRKIENALNPKSGMR